MITQSLFRWRRLATVSVAVLSALALTAAPAFAAWSPPATLSSPGGYLQRPRPPVPSVGLSANAGGLAVATWTQVMGYSGTGYISYAQYATQQPGGAWSAPGSLPGNPCCATILARADGSLVAAWSGYGSDTINIYSAIQPAGSGTWSTPVNVTRSPSGWSPWGQVMATDGHGNTVMAWELGNSAGTQSRAYASTLPAGSSTWSAPAVVSGAALNVAYAPVIATNAAGATIVAWQTYRYNWPTSTIYTLQVTTRAGMSGTWSAPVTLAQAAWPASQYSNLVPNVAIDGSGAGVAAWQTPSGIFASRQISSGGAWCTTTLRSSTSSVLANSSLAADSAGNAVATWTDMGTSGPVLQAAWLPAGSTTWQAPQALSGSDYVLQYSPATEASADGLFLVSWVDNTSGAVRAVTRTAGSAWSSAATLGSVGTSRGRYVNDTSVAAVSSQSSARIAWLNYQPPSPGYDLQYVVQAAVGP